MKATKKILLIYPEYPETFWSFKHALRFVFKKATVPPLGLLTVASLLPEEWEKKLIDMNVSPLKNKDITWADYIFISAISIQKKAAINVIYRCHLLGATIVAGGPLFTIQYNDFEHVKHFVLGEAENNLPKFLFDLQNGHPAKVYPPSETWVNLDRSPVPAWELIKPDKYASLSIQYCRGCPYDCEFCDISTLYGHKVRTKSTSAILNELEKIYAQGWRDQVFFVDDNFIGNKRKLKTEVLPAIISWNTEKKHPFQFNTQTSIELADDENLLHMMVEAGFNKVFIGIESPDEQSLTECNKAQNKNRDLIASIKKIQRAGIQVQGGFIVGFDNDPQTIFDTQVKFIQESGIVTAMVGLLHAFPRTKLHQRLTNEKRIIKESSGDNTDFSLNFIPKMGHETLVNGYRRIMNTIYSPKKYYERVKIFLKEFQPQLNQNIPLKGKNLIAFMRSIFYLGIIKNTRVHYWKLFFWTIFHRPRLFKLSITLSIYGFHFQQLFSTKKMQTALTR
ncbi:MAG: DUF4070 domain-containing protein [Bacteroidales bacterium]|nr:DUF4070 domain-containing protein [Bacteroidales bacterium]